MNTPRFGARGIQLLTCALLGIGAIAGSANAQITQNPTAFAITIDGKFTNANEWSDVQKVAFNPSGGGTAYTYTTVDAGKTVLALMYDDPASTTPYGGALSGPVEFNVGSGATQQHFQVLFSGTSPSDVIQVWRSIGSGSAAPFNVQCPGFPDQIVGHRMFTTSPNSAVPHNIHEVAVRLDCSDGTLNCVPGCPGIYSPLPSHWGASIANGGVVGHCVLPDTLCSDGQPRTVDCSVQGSVSVFGNPVSNACVAIPFGQGGKVQVTKIPLASESTVPATSPFGGLMLAVSLALLGGTGLLVRRRASADQA